MENGQRKSVDVALWRGSGPEPGYAWTVIYLSSVWYEYQKNFPEAGQQEYIRMQVRDLARHPDPTLSLTLSIDRVGSFWELRDKGGPLGTKTNMRMYFDFITVPHPCIRVLGFDDKKNDGQIYGVVKDRIDRRQQKWDEGVYPIPEFPKRRQTRLTEGGGP